jgi:hypothetical protein
MAGFDPAAVGTGSDIARAGDWRWIVEARVPIRVDVAVANDSPVKPDSYPSWRKHWPLRRKSRAGQWFL